MGCRKQPDPQWYSYKLEKLAILEQLHTEGFIDLRYGDESGICSEGYVPYGWQFPKEKIYIPVERGFRLNCFALINRENNCWVKTTQGSINAEKMIQWLDEFSFQIQKITCIVWDNARIHTAKKIKQRIPVWQQRGLYVFYLPTYSPHLNIAEILWRKLKKEWLKPQDYCNDQQLEYVTKHILANVGKFWRIKFSPFNKTNFE